MFTPFSFIQEEAVAGWTPADFTDIKAWWIADSGVTMNSSDPSKVEKWTDSVGGYEVTQSFNSNPTLTAVERSPTTSSAWPDLNNQPIIRFGITTNATYPNGAPQYLYSTGSFPALSNESYTQIIICEYIGRNATYAYTSAIIGQISSGNVKRLWFDRIISNGNVRNVIQLGGPTQLVDSGDLLSLGTEKVMWNQYQAGSGDTYFGMNTTTGSLEYNGATTNDTWSTTTLFGINGLLVGTSNIGSIFEPRANDMAVAEVILIYGEPSAGEWSQFKSYVSTKYGITIS